MPKLYENENHRVLRFTDNVPTFQNGKWSIVIISLLGIDLLNVSIGIISSLGIAFLNVLIGIISSLGIDILNV